MTRPVILDCDTGSDDAVAILLAALHPDVDLLGVCSVWGNHDVEVTTANTVRVLEQIGRTDVPVHAGLGPPPDDRPVPAVEWLVETLRGASEPITLVPTGPLTNIAAALRLDPRLVDSVDEVVAMGGTTSIRTSVTPYAERNVWNDAVAADAVLRAGFPRLTLVTLDATYQALMGEPERRALEALDTPAARLAAEMIAERVGNYADQPAMQGRAPVHDPLCVALLLDPAVAEVRAASVRVELDDPETYGRTHIDTAARRPNAAVTLSSDRTRLFELMVSAFG